MAISAKLRSTICSTGAARYAATADGLVPWRERPTIFRKGVIARIPPFAEAGLRNMRMSIEKIPVTIITGFLGAGKTTLVRHLMQNPQGRRLAILVNEFGDLGIDGDILKGCADANCPEDAIVELTNGCLCCTVADDFVPTIAALLARPQPPDHILIETSGLALPKPLLKAFEWPDLRSRITVDGVIAVADAEAVADGRFAPDLAAIARQRLADESIDHDTPLGEVFEDQVACADIVILNKADLVDPDRLAAARKTVLAEAPRSIPVLEVTEGRIDPRVVLGLGAAAEDDLDARPSHHEDHDEPRSRRFRYHRGDAAVRTPTPRRSWPGSRRSRATTACCAPRAMSRSPASRCGCWCRASAPACARNSTVRGAPTRNACSRIVVIGERGFDHAAITAVLTG